MSDKIENLVEILSIIRPKSLFVCGETYESIEWKDVSEKPTKKEILDHVEVVKVRKKRGREYPSIEDQLDAIWKGGQAQADMKEKIDAVKTRNPKPQ